MTYVFKGSLHGSLCAECAEPLAGVTLRLYRLADSRDITAHAVANPKDTFGPVDDAAAAAKQSRLLAEVVLDERGEFELELGQGERYDGGAFEVDIYCGTVPRLKLPPHPPGPQFTITTLQPMWRGGKDRQVAAWEYVLPQRIWCAIRGRLGAWVICGRVRHCKTGASIGGVRVRAFDADWLQDDALGEAITDGSGHFRIDYSAADFKKTLFSPLINLEWTGGPDVYFRVETLAGTALLKEPASRGRQGDRENVGPCFCAELCLEQEQPPVTDLLPVFDALGGYLYASAIDSAVGGSGRTVGDHRAFYGAVRLNGVLSKTLNGKPMEYRFEVRPTDATGNPTGPWAPVTPAQLAATHLGKLERYAPTSPSDPNPIKTFPVLVDPALPAGDALHAAIVGGWVRVPQWSNVFGPEGAFSPNGNMLNVVTGALAASPTIGVSGVKAGASSTSLGASLSQDRHLGLRMRVREVGNPASEASGGTCFHVAIDNTRYDGVAKGGSWAPSLASGELCVCSVDAVQLRTNGCAGLHAGLDVLFTAAHPNLGEVTLTMAGPGGPYAFTLPPPVPGERFGTATNAFSFAALPDCAYIITLRATMLLTTGDAVPDPVYDQIGFCKK